MMMQSDKPTALIEIEQQMRQMLNGEIKPYDAGWLIWKASMSNMVNASEIMHPFWLIWGALTDWVEVRPLEEDEAEAVMLRASREWLSLDFGNAVLRTAYFDKWIYEEMGYKKK